MFSGRGTNRAPGRTFAVFETNVIGLAAGGRSRLFRRFGKPYRGLGELEGWSRIVDDLAHWGDDDSSFRRQILSDMVGYLQAETMVIADDTSLKFRIAAGAQAHLERDALLSDPVWTRHLLETDIGLIPSAAVLGLMMRRLAIAEPDLVRLIIVALARTFPRKSKGSEFILGLLRQTPYYVWKLPI